MKDETICAAQAMFRITINDEVYAACEEHSGLDLWGLGAKVEPLKYPVIGAEFFD